MALDKVDTEERLTASITALPEEMTPERDLWSGIERAISIKQQEPNQNRKYNTQTGNVRKVSFMPVAWAASISLAVFISWGAFTPIFKKETDISIVKQPFFHEDLVDFMEQSFVEQKQTMLVSFSQANVTHFSVEMQDELTKLANARKAIRKALLADNTNADLLNLLDFTQQQELKLLEQLYRQYQII